jgi:putative PIN family toxin of toxin-antitoxin system
MNFERKRVVFDTSALIGVLTKPEGICNDALIIGVEQCRLLASEETLAEFVFVARRDKFDKYASRAEREYILTQYAKRVEKVTISVESTDCRDPKDNKFLSLALSGDADIIVTGDDDLLVLHPYKGIDILTIRDFVDRYRDESV